jgi:hypothetical protein
VNDDSDWELIDGDRTVGLSDVGAPGYFAATVITGTGETHYVLAQYERLGDDTARYEFNCPAASHEQLGPLPLEYVRRLTISRRRPQ